MHLAKGLEFRAVVVMACDEDALPLRARIDSAADEAELEDVFETERHLLYVAATRAGSADGQRETAGLRVLARLNGVIAIARTGAAVAVLSKHLPSSRRRCLPIARDFVAKFEKMKLRAARPKRVGRGLKRRSSFRTMTMSPWWASRTGAPQTAASQAGSSRDALLVGGLGQRCRRHLTEING